MSEKKNITVRIEEVSDIDRVGGMWQALEPDCAASYFQSWGWIGTWLRSLPSSVRPRIMIAATDNELVGLAILVPGKQTRHRVFRSHALFVNEAGRKKHDFIIEHNGFLLKAGSEAEILQACLRALATGGDRWDEVFISGIRSDNPLFTLPGLKELGLDLRVLKTSTSRYVDLAELRLSTGDYLASLSSNTRYQIRRAMRKYEETGPLALSVAATPEEAQRYFDQLKEMHQTYWSGKGLSGSFANEAWEHFHRTLISERFSRGEIQLVRIAAGEKIIGCLYNFVKAGWVYVLQSGFHYETSHALHPGYVSHYLAIEYNLKHGADIYDFLAGDAQYKSSLSQKNHELAWVVLQRERWKFKLEDLLRKIAHSLRNRRARTSAADRQ